MHLWGQRGLGILILLLLGLLVAVKRLATGSVLDRPAGDFLLRLVNGYNLFFLLAVNPAAALLSVCRRLSWLDALRVEIRPPWLLRAVEAAGTAAYVAGFLLMAWALLALGRHYQLGGSPPRPGDRLVSSGPYRRIRHPMYASALAVSLGLSLLLQSWLFAAVFAVYLALILMLIPREEAALGRAYGSDFAAYRETSCKLIPFLY